jgi:uncharacterized protein (DUF2384 family)
LEERNANLEETIAKFQSGSVKLQTAYKEESYNTQKKLQQLESENSTYSLRMAELENLCRDVHSNDDEAESTASEISGLSFDQRALCS